MDFSQKQNTALFETVVSAMSEGVVVHDATGAILSANMAAQEILGLSLSQMQGLTSLDPSWQLILPDGQPAGPEHIPSEISNATGRPCRNVVLGVHSHGANPRWLSINTAIVQEGHGHDGCAHLVIATFSDITEQLKARDQIQQTEQRLDAATMLLDDERKRLTAILDNADVGIISIDSGHTITHCNRQAYQLFGYKSDDLIGHKIDMLVPEAARSAHKVRIDGFQSGEKDQLIVGQWRKLRGRHKNGSHIPIRIALSRTELSNDVICTAIITDMTDVFATEDQLHASMLELRMALARAEDAAQTQRRFLANMSHELRTPLNAIMGYSEMLKEFGLEQFSEEKKRDYISAIHASGAHLLELINDVLDLNRIEQEDYHVSLEPHSIDGIVRDALRLVEPVAIKGSIALSYDGQEQSQVVLCDHRATRQCVINLLSNAIKYSDPGMRVSIGLIEGHETVTVRILDTGPGMPYDLLKRIGEPFLRSTDPATSSREGTGLGLAITKHLMMAQKGYLSLQNGTRGGLVAELVLPRASVI